MPEHLLFRLHRWGIAHPFWYYLVPLMCWVAFVGWGSLAPPDQLPKFDFNLADKLEHATSYSVLAVLILRGWVRHGPVTLPALLLAVAVASGWGLYMEFMQRLTDYRTFDLRDAAANAAGALLGLAAWVALRALLTRRESLAAAPGLSRSLSKSEDHAR